MSPPAGRPRKNTPEHIDAGKLPPGVYWDGARSYWYVREANKAGKTGRKRIAGKDAKLSDLHQLAEQRAGIDRTSLRWLCEEFERSPQWRELAEGTRKDYTYCRAVLCDHKTKAGGKFGDLVASRITRPLVQVLVDKLTVGKDGKETPSKAAHARRYLSRVWEWGANRGHVPALNPATGVDMPAERQLRRLPDPAVMAAVIRYAFECGQLGHAKKGSSPPYLWAIADLAYLCRLRGVEVVTLKEDAAGTEGIRTNRRKGSRDNIVLWTARLRAAWDFLIARRNKVWAAKKVPTPMRAHERPLVVAQDGQPLRKSSLNTAWQRLMKNALGKGIITISQRFSLHDLKRRGVTDTVGTRGQKQLASGHRQESMLETYDLSVPLVPASGSEWK